MDRLIDEVQHTNLSAALVTTEHEDRHAAKLDSNGTRTPLSIERVALTRRTGLALPPELSLEAWQRIGHQIFVITDSSAWWWGDWLVFGEERYPNRYRRAIVETSLDYQTLRNYAWVARRFKMSRRRSKLSFQHHVVVAALSDEEQDALLVQAEVNGWSRNELRRRVRASRNALAVKPEPCVVYQLNVDPDRQCRWQEAAMLTNEELIDWIVLSVDRAADALLAGEVPSIQEARNEFG